MRSNFLRGRNAVEAMVAVIVAVASALGVFYGTNRSIVFISSIITAFALFWLRKRCRIVYGAVEFVAGSIAIYVASDKGRGSFSAGFSHEFQRFEFLVVFVAMLAAIYIVVRGLDNIEQGLGNLHQSYKVE